MMRRWLKAQWQKYVSSLDADEALAVSTPLATVFVAAAMIVVFASLAYMPPLARLSGFENAWVSICLTAVAAALTLLAYKHECRGTLGSLATLLDSGFYSSAIIFAAVNTTGGVSIALAAVQAIVTVVFQAQAYPLTLVFGATMATPVVSLLLLFQPPLPVALILGSGAMVTLLFSLHTKNRRELVLHQQRLQSALGAADKIADESMQAALASTLLKLGHFLHELRNYQTAISANLSFVEHTARLDEQALAALQDAQAAQNEQEDLVRSTIEELQARARPQSKPFDLRQLLTEFAAETRDIKVRVQDFEGDFSIRGNPEHLRVVLLNLGRNAAQAGASLLNLDVRVDASGRSIQLIAHDDGPGIPEDKQEQLLSSFGISAKEGGSGLGLYLVRRYIELFGGNLRIEKGPLGGAAFVMRLPGNASEKSSQPMSHTRGVRQSRAS